MIPSLSLFCALAAVVLAVVVAILAVRGRPTGRAVTVSIVVLEVTVIAQAVRDAIGLIAGHRPAELGTHWGYLVSSVVVLPVALAVAQGDRGRWASAVLAVGLGALAVVVFRMQQTWYPAAVAQ